MLLGGLAVAFGFQMWPSLAAVCWFPWITRQGATWGLAAGLIGVIFTETFGQTDRRMVRHTSCPGAAGLGPSIRPVGA